MIESDSGLIKECSTHDSREGARAHVARGPEEYAVHRAIRSTVGVEKQRDGAEIYEGEGASNRAPQYL